MLSNLKKQSIAELTAEKIRHAILSGELQPGERLKEQELCDQLQISRTPLREAFRILQTQNLIQYTAFSGVCVTQLTAQYVRETWMIKALIEPETTILATKNITPESLAEIRSSLEATNPERCSIPSEFVMRDNEFHTAIAAASQNTELCRLIANIYECTSLPRSRTVVSERKIYNAHQEHVKIFEAMQVGDADRAAAYTREHLESSKTAILRLLGEEDGK